MTVACCALAGASSSGQDLATMTHADLIIANARIITMDPAKPVAEAMAIAGNRIIRVGSRDDAMALRSAKTRVHDNKGKTVIPGIIEGHVHLFIGAAELDKLDIRYTTGEAAITNAVKAYRAKHPKLKFLHAISAAHDHFGGAPITRHLLDKIVSDIPFIIGCFDHHTIWANTRALEAKNLMRGAKLPPGSEIVLGPDGLATGELREFESFAPILELGTSGGREALGIITGRNPEKLTPAQRKSDVETMRRGVAHANTLGITSMHNMDGNLYQLELLHELEKNGELNARVEVPFHFRNTMQLSEVDDAVGFREKYKTDMLHSGRVKLFIDGVMETLTALMLEDYPGHPGNTGAPLYSADDFNQIVARADSHGLQIAVHAIGDGGVRRTLDAYEFAQKKNGKRDSRHRIEHIELIHPDDIPRLAQLGVIASLQPIAGVGVPGNPQEPILSRIGKNLPYAYAWQTLRNTGAEVAFSSDWPVSPLDPFIGMQSAMTPVPYPNCPDQKQSLMDTLHAFTLAGAHMEFMEDRKGMVREGYLADIAVLNADMEKLPANEMASVKPVLTICDGRVVYEAI
jgi:predicted amidohydrolase YtcJ